jgi:hypothetical protein
VKFKRMIFVDGASQNIHKFTLQSSSQNK